jgi:hypothetical protein
LEKSTLQDGNCEILAVVKNNYAVGGILSYLDLAAAPGSKVVFLVREFVGSSLSNSCPSNRPNLTPSSQTGAGGGPQGEHARVSSAMIKSGKIARNIKLLSQKGIDVEVKMVTGYFCKFIQNYPQNGRPLLVVVPANHSLPLIKNVCRVVNSLGQFERKFPKVMVLYPNLVTRRYG